MSMSPDTVHSVEIDVGDLPTKSVTFAPTKATIIREINDVKIKPGANEVVVLGLDPNLDTDSVRVDGYGSATITNIQTELVPRKKRFEDVYPQDDDDDDDDDQSHSYLNERDCDYGVDKTAVELARQQVREAETILAASKNVQATSTKLVEFLDHYGHSMQAQTIEASKVSEFLDIYRKQRIIEGENHHRSGAEIAEQQREVEKARRKLVRAEIDFEKARKAASREIRQQQEKRMREKQQKLEERKRVLAQRRRFWTTEVGQVVINLDSSSPSTANSSRRSSIISANEKSTGDSHPNSLDGDTVNLRLTYVVPGASWAPRYELSINTPASSAKLVYRAEFENYTAETWKNSKVTFSTSQTSFSGLNEKIPVLDPWHIKLGKVHGFDTGNNIWDHGLQSQKEITATGLPIMANKGMAEKKKKAKKVPPGSNVNMNMNTSNPPFASFASTRFPQSRALFGSSTALPPPPPPPPPPPARAAAAPPPPPAGAFGSAMRLQAAQTGEESEDSEDSEDEDDALTLNPESHALGHQESQRQDYGLTTTYDLPGQRTISPSSVKRRHVIAELDLNSVTISHVLVPKLRCAAFLKARIKNTTSVSLLRGKAGMTVDGTFLGSTMLQNCEPNNFVDLSLGVDPSIQVTYAKPTVRRATTGFFAKDDCAIFTRTCWIKNAKKVAASITVLDQVPVSEDENLRVNILEPKGLAKEDDSADLQTIFQNGDKGKSQIHLQKNGQVKWNLDIQPGKDVKLVLEYESRIPSGQKIIGLD